MSTKQVHREILKLLIQVAWADGKVPQEEVDMILGRAKLFCDASDVELSMLRGWLAGQGPLPTPDIGFLRNHAEAAIKAAEELVVVDGKVKAAEHHAMAEIRRLLT